MCDDPARNLHVMAQLTDRGAAPPPTHSTRDDDGGAVAWPGIISDVLCPSGVRPQLGGPLRGHSGGPLRGQLGGRWARSAPGLKRSGRRGPAGAAWPARAG